jgi:hypothetical protein
MPGARDAATGGARGRRARCIVAGTVAALLLLCLLPASAGGHDSYPRLANVYFPTLIGADLGKLARWDLLVLPSRAAEWYPEELDTLRQLNPDIVLLAHIPVSYHGDWESPSVLGEFRDALYENDWWLRDTTGGRVVPPFGFGIINMTTWCPEDEHGDMLCDWLAGHIAEHLGPGGAWDGLFLDLCTDDISWVNGFIPSPVDGDGDGVADEGPALNASWKAGLRRMAERLRGLVGDAYVLVGNGNNTLYDVCNGSVRENFPYMHGDWYQNVMNPEWGYVAIESLYEEPQVNVINSIWEGEAGENGAEGDPAYERLVRLGLSSTLVYGDGYFSLDGFTGGESHSQAWWHPLYGIDLGRPDGRAVPAPAMPGAQPGMPNGEYLRMRRFARGVAVVNPTGCIQVVDLGGAYFPIESWNGEFFRHGGAVTEAVVQARSGEVLAGYGHRLAASPEPEAAWSGDGVTLTWDAVPGAARYSVYRDDGTRGGAGGDEEDLLAVVDQPCHVDTLLPLGGAVRYFVAAIDSAGCEGQLSLPVEPSVEQVAAAACHVDEAALAGPDDASYPRLANIYFPSLAGADLRKLARWDVLVLPARNSEWCAAQMDTIRRLNPRIVLLAHVPVGYHGDWAAPSFLGDIRTKLNSGNWWMRDTANQKVVMPFGAALMNMTSWCPRDGDGRRLCDWLPEHVASRLGPGGRWDGVYLDFCMDDISWANSYVTRPMDANNDRVADTTAELNASWRLGMRRMVERLRELVGDDYLVVTNGNNTLYASCNGSTREDFPNMHGGWYENVAHPVYGYVPVQAKCRRPSVSIVNGIWRGAAGENGAHGNPQYERQLVYGLASTLVYGNGYFSFDGVGGGGHCQAWWDPVYDVDLGMPVGRAESVQAEPGDLGGANAGFLRMRRFTNGVAVVNPTASVQRVDLGAVFYRAGSWNGHFYARSGAVSEVSLAPSTGELLVGSGHVQPGVPLIQGVAPGRDGLVVSWRPVAGVERYSVYRVEGPGGEIAEDSFIGVVEAPFFADGGAGGRRGTFRYAVAPIDASGCEGQLSRPVEVSIEPGSDLQVSLQVDTPDGQPAPESDARERVETTGLFGCAPNPATGDGTLVSFSIGGVVGRDSGEVACLTVYDAAGRVVRTLAEGRLPAGRHVVPWDGRDDHGSAVASGCYFLALDAGGGRETGKILVLR